MCYRYIALTNDFGIQVTGTLRALGMEPRGSVRRLVLFGSKKTPVLPLPSGGFILGDLYHRDGSPVMELPIFPHLSTQRALRQYLLDHYWGEYLLVQPADEGSDGITLMRDPSGGIACAYSLKQGFITSDLSIPSRLGLHHDRVDWEFVKHCLVYPYTKISRTGIAGISELLPGCILSINDQAMATTTMVWSPWTFVAAAERQSDPLASARGIWEATTSVVRAMAQTDQALLLQLSGGLDSSIVGACLGDASARIACCTLTTPLPGADERRYAGQMAEQIGAELLQQPLDFEDGGIEFPLPRHSLRPAIWALGHAVARAMANGAAPRETNSLFSGAGGDTVFCYLKSAAPAADAFRGQGLVAGWQAIINLSKLHGCTLAKAARLTLRKLYLPPKPPCKPDYTLLAGTAPVPALGQHPWFDAPLNALPGDRERIFELAATQLFPESALQIGPDHRRIRMPLLSQPVMEACLRVPSWMWISGGENRAVARVAFAEQLPQDVLNRRSKGTFMNYNSAVYRKNKEVIRRFLLDGCLQSHGLLDPHKLNTFLDSQRPARDRSFMRMFTLCMIENWARSHA